MKMANKKNKLLEFISDYQWIFVVIFFVCTLWYENEHIIKSNKAEITEITNTLNAIDEELDKNAVEIRGLKEQFKYRW